MSQGLFSRYSDLTTYAPANTPTKNKVAEGLFGEYGDLTTYDDSALRRKAGASVALSPMDKAVQQVEAVRGVGKRVIATVENGVVRVEVQSR